MTKHLSYPRLTHILTFSTKIGRIVAIDALLDENDEASNEPNRFFFGVLALDPSANPSQRKAVDCCILTANKGPVILPRDEFVSLGLKDLDTNMGNLGVL